MNRFDRKLGADFLDRIPRAPGVYLFKDEDGQVVYVGKAKDLRRRLSAYRRASRRRAHRKMRMLVREISAVEIRPVDTEKSALLLEGALIRELRPRFNVEGAFSFLYPAIGIHRGPKRTLLCFTTSVDAFREYPLRWYGVFRSRPRAKQAFDTLVELLGLVGHLERTSVLGPRPDAPGSRMAGVRQLSAGLVTALEAWLAGESSHGLTALAHALLERPRARHDAAAVASALRALKDFFESDLAPLRRALAEAGRAGTFVPQAERDDLFLRAR
jgi:excinuclease ABC subunit C